MKQYQVENLSNAVAAICPDIMDRVRSGSNPCSEKRLWWELSSCILSSQVPYPLAVAAAKVIDNESLLLNAENNPEYLMKRLVELLSMPLIVEGRVRKYRFPVARAQHLTRTRTQITEKAGSLSELVDKFNDAKVARSWLVEHVHGVGPKQASMFLRNAGISYDLAILDRHVLNYMTELGVYSGAKHFIAGLKQYRQHEEVLREHARELDCPVGLLDWAIWIVMRVANRNMELVLV